MHAQGGFKTKFGLSCIGPALMLLYKCSVFNILHFKAMQQDFSLQLAGENVKL